MNGTLYRRFDFRPGPARRALLVLAITFAALSSQFAQASANILDREVVFNLPRQPVENALLGFSEQAHVQVLTASAAIPDRQTGEIAGRMRVRVALESILRGTGLAYTKLNDDTIAIQSSAAAGGAATGPGPPPAGAALVLAAGNPPLMLAQLDVKTDSAHASTSRAEHRTESDSVEEVVVTATKRGAETAQSLPLSISAISGDHLTQAGATVFSDWSHSVPGLVFQDQGPGDKRYIIRGVQSIGAPTVGVYLDNAVISGSNGEDDGGGKNIDIRLYDMERIEVLRGPQGTLYGAGSLSGTIRLLTKQPKLDVFEGDFGAELSHTSNAPNGNYDFNAMLNVPIVRDVFAIRAVGWNVNDSGYIDNIRLGDRGVNNEKTQGGRLTALLAPSDRMKITGSILYQDQFVGGKSFFFPADGDLKESEYTKDPRTDRATISQLDFNYRLDKGSFDISSAYFDHFVYFRFDSTPLLILFGVPNLPAVTLQPEKSSIWTNEARYSSNLSGPFQFVVGALHERLTRSFISSVVTVDANGDTTLTAQEPNVFGRTSAKQVQQEAVFGEGTYTFTPQWSVTGGLRWFRSEEHANSQNTYPFFGGPPEDPRVSQETETKVTPKVSVAYKVNADLLFYVLAAQGFRQGGTNDGGFGSLIQVPEGFNSDSLWNYEAGVKSAWLDHKLLLNLTAFAIRWSDIQTQNETTLGFTYIGNAGTASSNGLEAEVTMRPIRPLELISPRISRSPL
jgi:iron complex outermembrane receptor protein